MIYKYSEKETCYYKATWVCHQDPKRLVDLLSNPENDRFWKFYLKNHKCMLKIDEAMSIWSELEEIKLFGSFVQFYATYLQC